MSFSMIDGGANIQAITSCWYFKNA